MEDNNIPIKIQGITSDIYAGFWRRLGSMCVSNTLFLFHRLEQVLGGEPVRFLTVLFMSINWELSSQLL